MHQTVRLWRPARINGIMRRFRIHNVIRKIHLAILPFPALSPSFSMNAAFLRNAPIHTAIGTPKKNGRAS